MMVERFENTLRKHGKKAAVAFFGTERKDSVTFEQIGDQANTIRSWLNGLLNNGGVIGVHAVKNLATPSLILSLMALKRTFFFLDTINDCSFDLQYFVAYDSQTSVSNYVLKSVTTLLFGIRVFLYEHRNFQISNLDLRNILFVIRTSGTTSTKTMVRVSENSIFLNLESLREKLQINEKDVILFHTPLTFDPSIVELFLCFLAGSLLVIVDRKLMLNPNSLFDVIFPETQTNYAITFWQITPSNFLRFSNRQIGEIFNGKRGKLLRVLAFGGEQFPEKIQAITAKKVNKFRVFNLYGLTEISCWLSCTEITGSTDLNEGRNICNFLENNTFYEISDDNELLVGNDERFCLLDNENWSEMSDGKVLRSTGDRVKRTDDGQLLIKGRMDRLIKRFGIKLSLDSLEKKISQILEIPLEFIVCCWHIENRLLKLFVNLEDFNAKNESKIIDKMYVKLLNELEDSEMINTISILRQFPVNCNGKVDRKLLESFEGDSKNVESILFKYFSVDFTTFKDRTLLEIGLGSFTIIQIVNELFVIYPEDCVNQLLTNIFLNNISIGQIVDFCKRIGFKEVSPSHLNLAVKSTEADAKPSISMKFRWKYSMHSCVDANAALFSSSSNSECFVTIGSFSRHFVMLSLSDGSEIWQTTLNDAIEAEALISIEHQQVFIGTNRGTFYCLSSRNGSELWKFQSGDKIKSRACLQLFKVVFGSYDNFVYCLQTETGNLVWKQNLFGAISADICFFNYAHNDCLLLSTLKGSIYCLDFSSGSCFWKLNLESPIFSSPLILNEKQSTLWSQVNGNVVSIDFNGKKQKSLQLKGNLFGTLCKVSNTHVAIGTNSGCLYNLEIDNLSVNYSVDLGSGICKAPIRYNNGEYLIIALTEGCVLMLRTCNGSICSQYSTSAEIFSQPKIHNDDTLVFGCRDDFFHCLNIVQTK